MDRDSPPQGTTLRKALLVWPSLATSLLLPGGKYVDGIFLLQRRLAHEQVIHEAVKQVVKSAYPRGLVSACFSHVRSTAF